MPFGPIDDRARIWHPIAVIIGSFAVIIVWSLVPIVVLTSIDVAAGKADLLAPDTLSIRYELVALAVSFALILMHFLFWTRVVERRRLTSIGLFRGGSFRRYVNGVVYGALFALIASLAAYVAALHFKVARKRSSSAVG